MEQFLIVFEQSINYWANALNEKIYNLSVTPAVVKKFGNISFFSYF